MSIIEKERKYRKKQLKKARGLGSWAVNFWGRFVEEISAVKGKKRCNERATVHSEESLLDSSGNASSSSKRYKTQFFFFFCGNMTEKFRLSEDDVDATGSEGSDTARVMMTDPTHSSNEI